MTTMYKSLIVLTFAIVLLGSLSEAFAQERHSRPTLPSETDDEGSSTTIGRRDALLRSSAVMTAGAATAVVSFASASAPKPAEAATPADASAFVGTYSDPINHPGGKRSIVLLEDKTVGDYHLAEVRGGGGVGEPKSYVLPALILGGRAIIIDFSPKGGPRDFTGVLDGKDIKFLRDGNRWPRLE
mmetsp:Transcript_15243/g.36351  ORF Transcript_15243/g.36351 Transcript_15243/m.36351 type:complete len:185 (+) Transcript_15243:1-555(+)